MDISRVVQIKKNVYVCLEQNDLTIASYFAYPGSRVVCLKDQNLYIHLGNNHWGVMPLNSSSSAMVIKAQSDWAERDVLSEQYIKNKPDIPDDISDLTDIYEILNNGVEIVRLG